MTPTAWGSEPYVNVHQRGGLVGGQVDDVASLGNGIRLSASGSVATLSGTNGRWTSSWTSSYDWSAHGPLSPLGVSVSCNLAAAFGRERSKVESSTSFGEA